MVRGVLVLVLVACLWLGRVVSRRARVVLVLATSRVDACEERCDAIEARPSRLAFTTFHVKHCGPGVAGLGDSERLGAAVPRWGSTSRQVHLVEVGSPDWSQSNLSLELQRCKG
ncbi:hypothetical protein GCM10009747_20850 [Agromyces humatus]|uniref:Secreted protein n=1 Tax=Agromyces humatus TaxID=279573 RepID=A0ABP4WRZ7_9MICO